MSRWHSKTRPGEFFEKWMGKQDTWGDQSAQQDLAGRLRRSLFGGDMEPRMDSILEACPAIHADLTEVRKEILRITYDRNLVGRCGFCPRFFQRL